MTTVRRFVPLLLGILAAVLIATVAAFALPGASDGSSPAVASVEATAGAVGAAPAPVVVAKEPAATEPSITALDTGKIAAARDSFPTVAKADRTAADDKQAERVAAKLAAQEAEAERKAEEEAARKRAEEKAKAEADAQTAAKGDEKDQSVKKDAKDDGKGDGTPDEPKDEHKSKDEKGKDEKETEPAWWPEHVWAHAVSCTVTDGGATVVGDWDVWLKYGGDWAFVSASPAPAEVSGTDGDKVKLTYRQVTASLHKEHDGKAKYRGGPVDVTVRDAADPASTRTFKVDLWVVADADGTCPS